MTGSFQANIDRLIIDRLIIDSLIDGPLLSHFGRWGSAKP
jgi:hypothetical protein